MSLENKNIILINFDFPPNFGIGGRRWGKLAKGFVSKGFNVFVIKATPLDNRISQWTVDVEHQSIKTHSIPRKAQLDRYAIGNRILDGITYKLAIKINEFSEKGTPFDPAIGWSEELNAVLKSLLVETKAEWVFCSGAPFNLCYYTAEFLKKNGGFKLWVDLRDPWLKAKNFGIPGLSAKRYAQEYEKVRLVLATADIISSPSDILLDELREVENGKWNSKLYELKHFFDLDDRPDLSLKLKDEKIHAVYGGEIYQEGEVFLNQMAADLDILKRTHPAVYENLKISFYTVSPHKISQVFERHSIVESSNSIGEKIFTEIANADLCIIFLANHNRNFFTTKYFEYMPLQKPYLYIGPEGEVIKEIEAKKMGFAWQNFIELLKNGNLKLQEFQISERQLENNSLSARLNEILALTNLK